MTRCINHHASPTLAVLGASFNSFILSYKKSDGMVLLSHLQKLFGHFLYFEYNLIFLFVLAHTFKGSKECKSIWPLVDKG